MWVLYENLFIMQNEALHQELLNQILFSNKNDGNVAYTSKLLIYFFILFLIWKGKSIMLMIMMHAVWWFLEW